MIAENSPLLNLPVNMNPKQAVYIDGIRHAAQIIEMAYSRLCNSLTEISFESSIGKRNSEFTHIFLDVWAFIDNADRFRSLWVLQPNSHTLPNEFSKNEINSKLQNIRDIRNVSAHIAQKADQIVALNSSILGSISWFTIANESPLEVKTHFIRPGIMRGKITESLAKSNGEVNFTKGSGGISIVAGKHSASLSDAYYLVCSIIQFAEEGLSQAIAKPSIENTIPRDMFGSADINMDNL